MTLKKRQPGQRIDHKYLDENNLIFDDRRKAEGLTLRNLVSLGEQMKQQLEIQTDDPHKTLKDKCTRVGLIALWERSIKQLHRIEKSHDYQIDDRLHETKLP